MKERPSDTPRTDAAVKQSLRHCVEKLQHARTERHCAELARTLERELNKLREEIEDLAYVARDNTTTRIMLRNRLNALTGQERDYSMEREGK